MRVIALLFMLVSPFSIVSAQTTASPNQTKPHEPKSCTKDQFRSTPTSGETGFGKGRNRGVGALAELMAPDGESITVSFLGFRSEKAAQKAFRYEVKNKADIVEPPALATVAGVSGERAVVQSLETNGVQLFSIIFLNGASVGNITSRSLPDAECFEKSLGDPHQP